VAGWRNRLAKGSEAVGVAFFAGMFAVFIASVAMQHLGRRPLTWSDEVCVVFLIWGTFWSAAFVVRHDEHVTFDILYGAAGKRGRRIMALAAALGAAALMLAALPATVDYLRFLGRTNAITPTLQWRHDYVFACFALFLAAYGLRLLWRGGRLASRDWERWV
jgi:TRAP-type C4-dicarboxylate transport system permease small subunit